VFPPGRLVFPPLQSVTRLWKVCLESVRTVLSTPFVTDGSEFLGRTIGEGEIVSTLKVLATGKVMDGAGRLLVCPLGRIWILDWIWIWIRMLEDTTMVWSSRSDLTTFFWGTLSLELALLTLVDALRCFV